jgi:uncharacterized protein (UPF0332 family)
MTDENRLANARAEIESARDALRVAEAALGLGIPRDAMSRTYYAAFHAARALLLLEGLEAKTHGGLAHLFNTHLVRSGRLEPRFNLLLARLFSYRQASDYGYAFTLGVAEVRGEIEAARELADLAERAVSGHQA